MSTRLVAMGAVALQNTKLLSWSTKSIPTIIFLHGNNILLWNDDISLLSQLQLHRFLASHNPPVRKAESNNHIEEANDTKESNKQGTFSSTEILWQSVCSNPNKWYDYRLIKENQKAPDFRHIKTGKRLWIESSETPAWVLSKLSCLGQEAFTSPPFVDNLWKSLFADPSKWFDNRNIKKNKKHPDFVHKENHNAVWIGEKTPAWVTPVLNSLQDEKFANSSSMEYLWKKFFADPSKWFDHRKIKKSNKHPDFKHRDTGETLWINDKRSPAWITPLLSNLKDEVFGNSSSMEDMWKALFSDPSKWIDYRKTKKSIKHPDFKQRDTSEALWINSKRTPAWVKPLLNNLDEAFATSTSEENLWIALFVDPSKWVDNRKFKKNIKHPDFVHKDTNEALWIDKEKLPACITSMLKNLQNEGFATSLSTDHLWKLLFEDPSKWFDNRKNKKSNKHPDFVHKEICQALWIYDKRTPSWVMSMLLNLRDEEFAPSPEVLASYKDKWKVFFASPSKWYDNRTSKKNPKAPDFKHIDTNDALWINKATPAWIISELNKLEHDAFAISNAKGSSCKNLSAEAPNLVDY